MNQKHLATSGVSGEFTLLSEPFLATGPGHLFPRKAPLLESGNNKCLEARLFHSQSISKLACCGMHASPATHSLLVQGRAVYPPGSIHILLSLL